MKKTTTIAMAFAALIAGQSAKKSITPPPRKPKNSEGSGYLYRETPEARKEISSGTGATSEHGSDYTGFYFADLFSNSFTENKKQSQSEAI